jgi:hypothetical protein
VECIDAFVCSLVHFNILFYRLVHSEYTILQFIFILSWFADTFMYFITLLRNLLIHISDIFRIHTKSHACVYCDRPHCSCDFWKLILNAKSKKDIS